jgi:hypothetical protein
LQNQLPGVIFVRIRAEKGDSGLNVRKKILEVAGYSVVTASDVELAI